MLGLKGDPRRLSKFIIVTTARAFPRQVQENILSFSAGAWERCAGTIKAKLAIEAMARLFM